MNTSMHALLTIALAAQLFSSCSLNSVPAGSLDDLDVRLLSSTISANLMPFVAPDPVSCSVALLARNTSSVRTLAGLRIVEGELFLVSSNARLGTLSFATVWDGRLNPGEGDTVRLTKVTSPAALFAPPCGEHVRLRLSIRDLRGDSRKVDIDSLRFDCFY